MYLGNIVTLIQFFFAIVIGIYFFNLLRTQQSTRSAVDKESRKELDKLRRLRSISLSEPLSEKTRPTNFSEIIGQEDGLKALRAALCGPNPQHVIIYGPPGIGKTAAARVILEEAKKNKVSPFGSEAKFIEIDATTARFDERGIADPLIGSVHDPIYQGAGAMGMAGIPQPKPGAVTKAHGGILFIDEIGELHPIQMNKLLKVLEDRKVFLESAYYSSEDFNIPQHIHDIFQNGLPADFRLVGATTKMPDEIPPAIRSRCVEIFFRPLLQDEVATISVNACNKIHFEYEPGAIDVIKRYADNGREAVNVVQIAAGIAQSANRQRITVEDIEWVVNSAQISPRPERKIAAEPEIGCVNGLAVIGVNMGCLCEIEVETVPVGKGQGRITVTGIIEEEEYGGHGHVKRRKSMAVSSVENVVTVLRSTLQLDCRDYDIHVNFPSGNVDGPSAGISIATAIYSSIMKVKIDNHVAMTGEISIRGHVKPIGGVVAKIEGARQAGATRVIIPQDNWQEMFKEMKDIEITSVTNIHQVLELALVKEEKVTELFRAAAGEAAALTPGDE